MDFGSIEETPKKKTKRRKDKKNKINKKDKKVIIICSMIFIICLSGIIAYYIITNQQQPKKKVSKKEEKQITIVDPNSNERPLAVMIDNNVGYDKQAGLQDSYINYEIIVEGGLTRIMSLYKDKDVSLIGPVRSSRHYFLDYASESDAIYAHYGWSTYAQNDIKSLGIDNINGLTEDSAYWRDKTIQQPHNVFTDTNKLYASAKKLKYSTTSDDWELLNYTTDEVTFKDPEEGETDERIITNNISLKYSNYQTTSYTYDVDNKYYLRFMDGKKHIDKETGNQLHYKNIIIEQVENTTLDTYGRQDLDTPGTGNGYYITNGYALPITWRKNSRTGKTTYTYSDGNNIKVNDGNTFIQIVPITTTPEFN